MTTPPVALTVAGSDSGAGAGIQVDLKTFAAHRIFGVSAITAVTVQNTAEVRAVHPVPPDIVAGQIDCLLDDFTVVAAKAGMLATAETVEAVAGVLLGRPLPHLVIDPVLISSSGARLTDDRAVSIYIDRLFPLADLVTPNMGEAAVITGEPVTNLHQMEQAARAINRLGARNVLLKGGHLFGQGEAVDLFFDGDKVIHFAAPWVDTPNVHGTGCTLSAAIVSGLAHGTDLPTAIRDAKTYVHRALASASTWRLGSGHGPLDHFEWTFPRPHDRATDSRSG